MRKLCLNFIALLILTPCSDDTGSAVNNGKKTTPNNTTVNNTTANNTTVNNTTNTTMAVVPNECGATPMCGPGQPVYNTDRLVCVACGDCGVAAPICDAIDGKCVVCLADTDCAGVASICDLSRNACLASCAANAPQTPAI